MVGQPFQSTFGKIVLVGVTFLALLVSGCAGAPAKGTSASPTPTISTSATHTAETGGIEGILMDNENQPIVGAEVGILKENVSVLRTSATGKFAFSDLAPGKHNVAARMLGFTDVVKAVDVVAGETTKVTLVMEAIPQGTQNALSPSNNTLWVHCKGNVGTCFMNGMQKDDSAKAATAGYNALGFILSGDDPGVAYFRMPLTPAVEANTTLDTGKTIDFILYVGGCLDGVDSGYITVTFKLTAGGKVIATGEAQSFNYQGNLVERKWSIASTEATLAPDGEWAWSIEAMGAGSQICIGSGGQFASRLVLPVV